MSNKNIYRAKDLLENKKSFVVAKVVDTEGSTPRKKGAWLLMDEEEKTYGTVGGGKLEAAVEKICKETLITKENSKIYHFGLKALGEDALDMRCGGDAKVLVEYIDAEKPEEFIVEFDLNSKAYIFGGGHVGKALEPVLRYVNFNTVILDDREEFANSERFPHSKTLVIESYNKAFDKIHINEDSYIIIVTRGHMGDYEVVKDAIKFDCPYIGMIGSKSKNAAIFEMLRKDGFNEEQIAKIHAPIGLSINAETPEEIGISIAGEMINVRATCNK